MRVRTTWNNDEITKRASMPKQADPTLMNQDHVKVQPPADKYVTGDPSTFGEDVNTDDRWKEEAGKRNDIGMPDFRKDTFAHPEKTAGLNEALLIKKADLATSTARLMLAGKKFADDKTAEQSIEDQAFNLMFLPDQALLDTHARLAAEQEQGQAEQEQQAQAKAAGEMPDFIKEKIEEKKEDEKKSDDSEKKANDQQQAQDQSEKKDEDPQAKEAAIALQAALRSGDKAKIASALGTQVKIALSIAKKAAQEQLLVEAQDVAVQAAPMGEQMITQAQQLVQAIQAGQSGQQMAQSAAQMAQSAATYAGTDPKMAIQAAKLASQCAKLVTACMSMAGDDAQQQVAAALASVAPKAAQQEMTAEQMQAAQQAQQEALASAQQALQAAGQIQQQVQQGQGQQTQAQAPVQQQTQEQAVQSMDDQLLNDMMGGPPPADAGMDGLSLEPAPMDVGEMGLGPEDEVLTQLFTANQEVQDAQEAQQGQDKQAHAIRTASTRTVGTRPSGGVAKIGGAAGAPAGGGEVNKLASLWQTAPDVRDAFGLPRS